MQESMMQNGAYSGQHLWCAKFESESQEAHSQTCTVLHIWIKEVKENFGWQTPSLLCI